MSFSYNPYAHVEIVIEGGEVKPYCHGCGKSEGWPLDLDLGSSIDLVFALVGEHIRKSHQRTPEDFAAFSVY
jgi:hypothetical protein